MPVWGAGEPVRRLCVHACQLLWLMSRRQRAYAEFHEQAVPGHYSIEQHCMGDVTCPQGIADCVISAHILGKIEVLPCPVLQLCGPACHGYYGAHAVYKRPLIVDAYAAVPQSDTEGGNERDSSIRCR